LKEVKKLEAKASVSQIRIAPKKVRVVLNLVRNRDVGVAMSILENTQKAASVVVSKLIKSAVANAENNYNLNSKNLYIHEIYAGEGSILKRVQPRAKGRCYRIKKRTSRVWVVLREKE
jgi:large subunit ribosomal protein L22